MHKIARLLPLTLLLTGTLLAQEDSVRSYKWLVPDFAVAQYAGSIGFVSAGAGYELFKRKGNLDLLIGYVPAFTGSKTLETVTLKFTFSPFETSISKKVTLYPLTGGVYISYTPGRHYSSTLPSWYPDGYYWWSEAIRTNIFIGAAAKIATDRLRAGSSLTPYFEIGTNEIKLVSYVQNLRALDLWDILHAGIGVRYRFVKEE